MGAYDPDEVQAVTVRALDGWPEFLTIAQVRAAYRERYGDRDPNEVLAEVLAEQDALLADAAGLTHAGLIIRAADTGRVLLTQRYTDPVSDDAETVGAWEWPSGGLDDGEDPLEGAIREFEEETGLQLPEGAELRDSHANETDTYRGHIIVVPDETWTVGCEFQDKEVMGIGWFDLEDVQHLLRPECQELDPAVVAEAKVAGMEFVDGEGGPVPPPPPAAPAAAPKPPVVLIGLELADPSSVPQGGVGSLPYMADRPYLAIGEIKLKKDQTPEQLAATLAKLESTSTVQSTVQQSLTASDTNPPRRAALLDPQPLGKAYAAIKAAVEGDGFKWGDYPFAVQLGSGLSKDDVVKLKGTSLAMQSPIVVLADGTVVGAPPSATGEETPVTDTAAPPATTAATRTGKLIWSFANPSFPARNTAWAFAPKTARFANPWHDDIGRFAPKGQGSRGGGLTSAQADAASRSSIAGHAAERDLDAAGSLGGHEVGAAADRVDLAGQSGNVDDLLIAHEDLLDKMAASHTTDLPDQVLLNLEHHMDVVHESLRQLGGEYSTPTFRTQSQFRLVETAPRRKPSFKFAPKTERSGQKV